MLQVFLFLLGVDHLTRSDHLTIARFLSVLRLPSPTPHFEVMQKKGKPSPSLLVPKLEKKKNDIIPFMLVLLN